MMIVFILYNLLVNASKDNQLNQTINYHILWNDYIIG
jgi:hypothetical protein